MAVDLATLVGLLGGGRPTGRGWQTRCPCHDDEHPSLTVTQEGNRILLYCHAGCRPEDILARVGLSFADLFLGDAPAKLGRTIAAAYPYTDATGKLLYEVVRYLPKGFAQRRPGPDGEWIWSLSGISPVLYRLPQVVRAVQDGTFLWVVEGEKDADRLASLGLDATTAPMGAGKWRREYSEVLRGGHVAIIPDNDDPGRRHAAHIAESLRGTVETVRVIDLPGLPPKGDVSDWLNAGNSVDDLMRLARETPGSLPDAPSLAICMEDVEPEPLDWLWHPYIPLGKLVLLEGDPGVGKTYLALALAAAVSKGLPLPTQTGFTGEPVGPANVLYLTAEDGLADTLRPRLEAAGADLSRVYVIPGVGVENGHVISLDRDLALIDREASRLHPGLIIVDPLQAYLGAKVDAHRANETRPILAAVGQLAQRHRCALVLVRHLNKVPGGPAIYRGLGSIDFAGAARSMLLVGRDPDHEGQKVVAHVKSSLELRGRSQVFRLDAGVFRWAGTSDLTADDLLAEAAPGRKRCSRAEAADFLRERLSDGPVPSDVVRADAEEAGIPLRTLERGKQALGVTVLRRGQPGKQGGGQWNWSLPDHPAGESKSAERQVGGVKVNPPDTVAEQLSLSVPTTEWRS